VVNKWKTETLFHTYSQFAAVPNIPPKPTEEEMQTESKLQEILEKVLRIQDSR
jgi:Golgi SNAP receptor complex protein 1